MTTEQYNKAVELARKLKGAREELREFRILESPQYPLFFKEGEYTDIRIEASGNGSTAHRKIRISKEMAKFFYFQELNRLQANVHHLETEFSKL